jgi:dihydrofolate reductase
MRISLIVALARNGTIGRQGGLPWRLSADLKRFKSLTMGHYLIMGRKTFDSLERPLPGRVSIVMTHQSRVSGDSHSSPVLVRTLDEALQIAKNDSEVFIVGGAQIYRLVVPRTDRLYVTWVEADIEGDTVFPDIDWNQWQEVSRERHSADAKNQYDYTFCTYDRISTKN